MGTTMNPTSMTILGHLLLVLSCLGILAVFLFLRSMAEKKYYKLIKLVKSYQKETTIKTLKSKLNSLELVSMQAYYVLSKFTPFMDNPEDLEPLLNNLQAGKVIDGFDTQSFTPLIKDPYEDGKP